MTSKLDSKIPEGNLEQKWTKYRSSVPLVNPSNKRSLEILIIGSGLAGASAAASFITAGHSDSAAAGASCSITLVTAGLHGDAAAGASVVTAPIIAADSDSAAAGASWSVAPIAADPTAAPLLLSSPLDTLTASLQEPLVQCSHRC